MKKTDESTKNLINQLRKLKSPREAREMLEERGRSCPSESMLKKARESKKGTKAKRKL